MSSTIIRPLLRYKNLRDAIRNVSVFQDSHLVATSCRLFSTEVIPEGSDYQLGDFSSQLKPFLKKKRWAEIQERKKGKVNEVPIIKCRRSEYNHYRNQQYDKFKPIPLASENWKSDKSKGDFFTINIYTENYGDPLTRKDYGTFQETILDPRIVKILEEKSIIFPSQVQAESIKPILERKNNVIAAETGCGKTLAYMAPMVHQILDLKENIKSEYNSPLAIILTPSRELSEQILMVAKWFKVLGVTSHLVVGGAVKQKIANPSVKEVDILVATPGILNKLTGAGIYSMKRLRHVVLDEADTLLDDSFNELVLYFLRKTNVRFATDPGKEDSDLPTAQLTLVSATMPTSIPEILGEIVDIDNLNKIKTDRLHRVLPHIKQKFYRVGRSMKPAELLKIMRDEQKKKIPVMIFCNRSETCYYISEFLHGCSIDNINLCGTVNLYARGNLYRKFLHGEVKVLVCTDIASRGLDTTHVEHVINYDFPFYASDYIHRCGRTGRLGTDIKGKVTNFIAGKNEVHLVQKIETAVRLGTTIENVNANIKRIITFKSVGAVYSPDVEPENEPVELKV